MFGFKADPETLKDLTRLLKSLNKEAFSNLSYDEQNEVLDEFMKLCMSDGFNDADNPINLKKLVEECGYETVRDDFRKAILHGRAKIISMPLAKSNELFEKMDNKQLSRKDIENFMHEYIDEHEDSNDFTTYSILRIYTELIEDSMLKRKDEEPSISKDLEPFINIAYVVTLASIVGNKETTLGKLFDKYGMQKVSYVTVSLVKKMTDCIIDFCKGNDISPEEAVLSMLGVCKVISHSLGLSLDNYNDKMLEDALTVLLSSEVFEVKEDQGKERDTLLKHALDPKHQDKDLESFEHLQSKSEKKKSANADKKDKTNQSIRQMLMDD